MSYDFEPEWTRDIACPDADSMVCPVCGLPAFNARDVMRRITGSAYSVRHIPPTLTFTCGNPQCDNCDRDFEYALSVTIAANPVPIGGEG